MKNKVTRALLSTLLCVSLVPVLPAAADEKAEPVELTYCGTDYVMGMEDTEVIDYIEDKLNIKLKFVSYTADQWAAGLASGDLPDIFQIQTDKGSCTLEEAIEAGVIVELSDLIDEYGQNIQKNIPNVLNYMREYRSDGTGDLYGITTSVPVNNEEGTTISTDVTTVGFRVRWDYYKEMGYPEINSEDDFLNMLKEMQEAHPTTESGATVYGFGGFTDMGLWAYYVPYVFQHGWMGSDGYLISPDTDIQPMFQADGGVFKDAMKFLNKANRMGLCDPEMFTMKTTDFAGKHANLQYLCVPNTWYDTDAVATQLEQGVPQAETGWRMIPDAFPAVYGGYPSEFGMSDRPTVISKSCKNPEAAMQFLDYVSSFEGSRLLLNGIEGEHWEVMDGVRELTDETLDRMSTDSSNFEKETGIGIFWNMVGLSGNSKDEDGTYLSMRYTDRAMSRNLSEGAQEFSEHYGVEYPRQAYADKILYYDLEPTNLMEPLDSDMKMISTQCGNYYLTLVAKLVNAETDEDFEAAWDQGIEELNGMGYNELMETIQTSVAEAKEKVAKLRTNN